MSTSSTPPAAQSFANKLLHYLQASFPVLYVETHEEQRCLNEILRVAKYRQSPCWTWTSTKGWMELTTKTPPDGVLDIQQALALTQQPQGSLCVLLDAHPYLESPELIRTLRDLIPMLKATERSLIFLSPRVVIPTELEKDITLLPFELPTKNQLGVILDSMLENAKRETGLAAIPMDNRSAILDATLGLTTAEAENVLSLAFVTHHNFCEDAYRTIQREKASAVRKTGILEYYEPNEDLAQVGGNDTLKNWLRTRAKAFSDDARAFGLPPSRGVLLVGVPGSGKSLIAKATSATWKLPVLRLDMGKVFSSLMGSSEENLRRALAFSEAISPCILWIDEIEKGLAGIGSSGHTDSGVTARVIGTFLTWLNEKTKPVFVIATANDFNGLPAELLRKGRFDEIFFVDLPTEAERLEILTIHLTKRNRNPPQFELQKVVDHTDGFGGSELEELVISGLYDAFDAGRDLTTEDLIAAAAHTTPLSRLMKERIKAIREWAQNRARPATTPRSKPRTYPEMPTPRRLRLDTPSNPDLSLN